MKIPTDALDLNISMMLNYIQYDCIWKDPMTLPRIAISLYDKANVEMPPPLCQFVTKVDGNEFQGPVYKVFFQGHKITRHNPIDVDHLFAPLELNLRRNIYGESFLNYTLLKNFEEYLINPKGFFEIKDESPEYHAEYLPGLGHMQMNLYSFLETLKRYPNGKIPSKPFQEFSKALQFCLPDVEVNYYTDDLLKDVPEEAAQASLHGKKRHRDTDTVDLPTEPLKTEENSDAGPSDGLETPSLAIQRMKPIRASKRLMMMKKK